MLRSLRPNLGLNASRWPRIIEHNGAFMKLFDSVKASHEALQIAVVEADRELAISEQRYVSYWVPHYDDRTLEEKIF